MATKLPQVVAYLNERGQEMVSSEPVAVPSGIKSLPGTRDIVQQLLRQEMSRLADESGFETEEEANDFDVEGDPVSEWTMHEIAALEGPQLEALLAPYRRPPVEDSGSSATPPKEVQAPPSPEPAKPKEP